MRQRAMVIFLRCQRSLRNEHSAFSTQHSAPKHTVTAYNRASSLCGLCVLGGELFPNDFHTRFYFSVPLSLRGGFSWMNIHSLTIESTRSAISQKEFTPVDLAKNFYKKIKAEDPEIHAYLTLCEDRALQQAERIDRIVKAGDPLPPLAGVPIGIKDVLVTKGVRTTAGSKILENFIPPYEIG